jgi:periplasmic protein TonB
MVQPNRLRLWPRRLGLALVVVLAGALLWYVIAKLTAPGEVRKKRVVQQISLLKPPPPPPPKVEPPKLEPKKVEIKEKIDLPKPDQQPDKAADTPPPGPDLGLDAKGGTGTDGFGLVAKKGGSDLIGSATGGSGALGNRFAWYGALVKERIQESVARDKKLSAADYRINVNVWINASGVVTRAELLGSTGDVELDNALRLALRGLAPMREGAPGDMPQPVKLRIIARG